MYGGKGVRAQDRHGVRRSQNKRKRGRIFVFFSRPNREISSELLHVRFVSAGGVLGENLWERIDRVTERVWRDTRRLPSTAVTSLIESVVEGWTFGHLAYRFILMVATIRKFTSKRSQPECVVWTDLRRL
jgi:hypothetical protein